MGNLDVRKFKELIETSDDYKEFRENPRIKDRLHLLCLSGSHAYGTTRPTSDIDIRGIVSLDKKYASGAFEDWETLRFSATDTSIDSYKKAFRLIQKGNPDVLALVGQEEDDYLYLSRLGRQLVRNHSELLGSVNIYNSFIGYSNAQLRRLELGELNRLEHENKLVDTIKLNVLNNAIKNMPVKYACLNDKSVSAEFEIVDNNVILKHLNYSNINIDNAFDTMRDLKNISSSFGTKGKRNTKKTDFQLNKHCMHTVRGILMGIETLKTGVVKTYRKNDLPILLPILEGKYMNSDGTMNSSFYDIVDKLQKEADYAFKHSVLPNMPDEKKVVELYTAFTLDSLMY